MCGGQVVSDRDDRRPRTAGGSHEWGSLSETLRGVKKKRDRAKL